MEALALIALFLPLGVQNGVNGQLNRRESV